MSNPYPGDKRFAKVDVNENRFDLPWLNIDMLSNFKK